MYDTVKAIKAQRDYCKANDLPYFAPESGRCPRCGQHVYKEVKRRNPNPTTTGITVERAGSELITGCPHCGRSYCD